MHQRSIEFLFGIVLAVFVGAGLPSAAWAQTTLAPGSTAQVDVGGGSRVNVRAEASTQTAVVGQAAADDLVLVLESVDQGTYVWYRVRAADDGLEGWIRGDLLAGVASAPEETDRDPPDSLTASEPPRAERARLPRPLQPSETEPIETTRPTPGWVERIVDNLDAIDGCAATSSAPPIRVLDLSLFNPSVVGVLLLDSAGRSWNCVIMPGVRSPLQFDPAGSAYRLVSRNDGPMFMRAPEPPPEGECVEAVEVVDEDENVVVGNLIYDVC